MPGYLVYPFGEKTWDSDLWLSHVSSKFTLARAYAAQVHFVGVPHSLDSSRCEPRQPCQPQKITPHLYRAPTSQFRKKPPLERRPRYQRPVQIKKCRNLSAQFARFHAIFLVTLFPPRATIPSAKYFHPSSRTGNPRTRQNPAVAHVKICAPMRISI